jgi:hypothetical protein
LIRFADSAAGPGNWLVDPSPATPITDPTLPAGASLTLPEGFTLLTSPVTSSGLPVQVVVGSPPTAPAFVTATTGQRTVTATWVPPVSSGSGPVTGYVVTLSNGQSQTTAALTTSASFGSLSAGTYTVAVRAVSAVAPGPATSSAAVIVR